MWITYTHRGGKQENNGERKDGHKRKKREIIGKGLLFFRRSDIITSMMKIRDLQTIYEQEIMGEKRKEFEQFRAMLLEYNQRYNLTTIL